MKLKPCKNNILVKFYPPTGENKIIIPDTAKMPVDPEHRMKCKILQLSPTLLAAGELHTLDFVLLRPQFNFLVVDKENFHALISSDAIEAVVLDDTE